ncbi:MAG: response regulator [Chloroflexi bacterium]|nr:response regulator [Chloroflexota bacterium]
MATAPDDVDRPIEALTAQLAACHRQIDELRAANQALEQAAQHRNALLADLGHELRTPLSALLSLLALLQEQDAPSLNPQHREYLRMVEASGRHLLALLNDLLQFSQLQSSQFSLQFEEIDPAQLCATVLDVLRPQAAEYGLTLELACAPDLSALLLDPLRTRQILFNLLHNALKVTPAGGKVGVNVQGSRTQGWIRLEVWDTGPGIPAAAMPHLFTPFFQLDVPTRDLFPGTGLGLVLSQRLTHLHGGTLQVESRLGQGSRFRVELPWRDAPPPSAGQPSRTAERPAPYGPPAPDPPATAALPQNRRLLVLLAEDNEPNLFALSEYLNLSGAEVLVARTGPEALRLTLASQPDLLLLDVHLPQLDGSEVVRQLRAQEKGRRLPIVLITALNLDNDRVRNIDADACLGKPVDLDQLDRILDKYRVYA